MNVKAGRLVIWTLGLILSFAILVSCSPSKPQQTGRAKEGMEGASSLGKEPEWLPKDSKVAVAFSQKDIKELTRLEVIEINREAAFSLQFFSEKWGKQREREDALLAYLDHKSIVVVGNVAFYLEQMKCKRAVPKLIAVLQSKRDLWESRCISEGDLREHIVFNARERIVHALGEIGDRRAIAILKTYLAPNEHKVHPVNAAWALYKIEGKGYWFTDFDGKKRIFEPPPKPTRQQSSPAAAGQ